MALNDYIDEVVDTQTDVVLNKVSEYMKREGKYYLSLALLFLVVTNAFIYHYFVRGKK